LFEALFMSDSFAAGGTAPNFYCPNCGAPTAVDAQICERCGGVLPNVPGILPRMESPVVSRDVTESPYGGFWMRFVAMILDRLLIGVVTAPFSLAIMFSVMKAGEAVTMPETGQMIVAIIGIGMLALLAQWLYFAVMESSERQATFGKQIMGLKVTGLDGQRLTFARASGRFFAKIVSGLTLAIGFIIAAFTEKKQALHDMIAGTLVMKR
jgi:uncharacterized RDD family membrane protein YckC